MITTSEWTRFARTVAVIVCALTLMVGSLTPAGGEEMEPAAATTLAGTEDAAAERWWGAVGAAICGAGLGLAYKVPVVGMNPYVLAATIGGCVLGLLDVMTTE